ncbi:MAG TPA: ABC transporter permease subunit [Verrucomicrobiae bacterium]|nr:ABC transporter permease subunit [Verrucomicrobiae bacterium]
MKSRTAPTLAAPGFPDLHRLVRGLGGNPLVRRVLIIGALLLVWELYARFLGNPLLLPSCRETAAAFAEGVLSGELPARVAASLRTLLAGYGAGLLLAGLLTSAACGTTLGRELLETLAAMFNPLPAIALLPLALVWFGLGAGSIVFVLVHAVVWPVALATHAGIASITPTVRMVGRNLGLRGIRYILLILLPAALPAILTGLRNGWAFAWRTLIASELVFGVSSGSGGLGWFIYEKKNQLETASVFAGLGTVILIGIVVESAVFRRVEARTVRRWGMQS